MKGASRFTIMILAMLSFGIMALPSQTAAATSFSISVDAYPVSFTFWDSSPERVYVAREVRHYRDIRPHNDRHRHHHHYRGRGYDRGPCLHPHRYPGHARWHYR